MFPVYKELQDAYDFYNGSLFSNKLPECLITLQRQKQTLGYFSPERFAIHHENNISGYICEIAMNPEYFYVKNLDKTLSTLVHEMCHCKTYVDGTISRSGYHNKEWAKNMKEVGLCPTATGMPGGKETGDAVTHYIIEGGLFQKETKKLLKTAYTITMYDRFFNGIINSDILKVKNLHIMDSDKNDITEAIKDKLKDNNVRLQGRLVENTAGTVLQLPKITKNGKKSIYSCGCSRVWGKAGLEMKCIKCGNILQEIES